MPQPDQDDVHSQSSGTNPSDHRLSGALMVVGSASGVGKSTVSAALCRALQQRGHRVAPYKAQNMSNHAAVTADGGEIGRAQAQQALAAGVEPTVDMNPILLKPVSNTASHMVVLGKDQGRVDGFHPVAGELKAIVLDAYTRLRHSHDVVIMEGAGGAAEINLFDRDLVNLPLAHAANVPALLVVDIDRGGAFAAAHGTIDLLPPHLRQQVRGIIINQFRGDVSLLDAGLRAIEERTGVPVLGVLPHLGPQPLLGAEDSLDMPYYRATPATVATQPLRIAAIRLPHLSNPSDLDPLMHEPGVSVTWTTNPADVMTAHLVILPGSRATVADLDWLQTMGLHHALSSTPARILGLCAGYQMLGRQIVDTVESDTGTLDALGLLATDTTFHKEKTVRQQHGTTLVSLNGQNDLAVDGYEIRFGQPANNTQPFLMLDGQPEGQVSPDRRIFATSLHGVLDNDTFRAAFLADTAASHNLPFAPHTTPFLDLLNQQSHTLAAWVNDTLDLDVIEALVAEAAPLNQLPGW